MIGPALDSIAGRRMEISRWRNSQGNLDVSAAERAAELVSMSRVVGVVGHAGSRDALLAGAIYQAHGVPDLVPVATSRKLAALGGWVFPLAPDDSAEGAFLSAYAFDSLHARRIVVLYVGDEYGMGIRDGVRAALRARGADLADDVLVPHSVCWMPQMVEVQRLLVRAAVRRSDPEVVVLAVGNDGGCLAQMVAVARPGTWVLGADGAEFVTKRVGQVPTGAEARTRRVVLWQPGADAANATFMERARRVMRRAPNPTDALTYDAYLLLATAVREGGGTRAGVRAWLESLGKTRPPFAGVSGPISFDHAHRVGGRLYLESVPVAP
ncbi:MAG: ABC transporter substrate-binding protein [Gemmatimonadales bacterium]